MLDERQPVLMTDRADGGGHRGGAGRVGGA
jgi:hypothetical protein